MWEGTVPQAGRGGQRKLTPGNLEFTSPDNGFLIPVEYIHAMNELSPKR